VPLKVVEPILKTLYELFDKIEGDELKISKYDAHLIGNIDEGVEFKGKKELLELSKKLKDFKGIKKIEPPKSLKANLREYQKEGLNWLNFLNEFGFGGILADDMGLGKTIQTLSLISYLKEQGKLNKPILVVMPTSLIFNWKDEIEKFTPNLSYEILYGVDRKEKFENIDKFDIILTTYQLVARDVDILGQKEFSYIILDESQKIKNPKTKMAKAIKSLKSEHKLALSGTPIENNLEELWSIFSFLMPGFLGDLKFFKNYYQKEIEQNNSIKKMEHLRKKITPFILRRTKNLVAKELPKKTEIIKYAEFESTQARLYESVRVAMEKKVKEAISKKGLNRSHITILDALLKLRQICCDPSLLKLKEAQKVKKSAKLELLFELVDKLLQENKKILLFSQFTSMLDIIEEELNKKDIKYTKLTGSTRKREEVIKEFKKEDTKIFLISLKAGGVGLNLTEADTIIHYDPWWNPAVENQATDRAYRIGQDKKVFVYKLIVKNSIEQKILELQKKKAKLQESIYDNKDREKIDGNELLELLKS
jgi:SNF2 family DNA or RNA helicase